jgi:hypothetical protein
MLRRLRLASSTSHPSRSSVSMAGHGFYCTARLGEPVTSRSLKTHSTRPRAPTPTKPYQFSNRSARSSHPTTLHRQLPGIRFTPAAKRQWRAARPCDRAAVSARLREDLRKHLAAEVTARAGWIRRNTGCVSASIPQPPGQNVGHVPHSPQQRHVQGELHGVIPVLPMVLEKSGESDLFGKLKQHQLKHQSRRPPPPALAASHRKGR